MMFGQKDAIFGERAKRGFDVMDAQNMNFQHGICVTFNVEAL